MIGIDYSDMASGALGAIVGGAAAILGGVVVNRREVIRSARVQVFEEILPRLEDKDRLSPSALAAGVTDLRRASPKLTRGDRREVKRIRLLAEPLREAWHALIEHQTFEFSDDGYGEGKRRVVPPEYEDPFNDCWNAFAGAIRAFDDRLEGKIL